MENLTPENIHFPHDAAPPEGFTAPGKSLIREIERLRESVLMLCDLHKQLSEKVDAALNNPITKEAA